MSDNWIVQNLQNALNTWNEKFAEIWSLLTTSPENFQGGGIWRVILNINRVLQGVGLALLVLFFVYGLARTCTSLQEIRKPEHALRYFIRFALAKGLITYGMDLMMALLSIAQGVISSIMSSSGISSSTDFALPEDIVTAVESVSFFDAIPLWAVSLIGTLFITVMSYIMILTVYGRFFKLYMYTALAPLPLSTFAGEQTQNIGKTFLRSYCAVLLEGAVIVLSCIIFSLFATGTPAYDPGTAAATQVWSYIGGLIFNMLILVGCVKMSDRIIREMMGL